MSAETGPKPPSPDITPPEVLSHLEEKTGFVTRFLIGGDQLDPKVAITQPVQEDQLMLKEQSFVCANRAAAAECTTYWEKQAATSGGPTTYEDQFNVWLTTSADALISPAHTEKTTRLKSFLQTVGSSTYETLDQPFATSILEKVQSKYFQSAKEIPAADGTPEQIPVDTELFVIDTLQSYNKSDGTIDTAKLISDLPSIKWFCRIFGDQHMDTITADIIAACAAQKKHAAEIVKSATQEAGDTFRINEPNLKKEESEELAYLAHYAKSSTIKPAEPPANISKQTDPPKITQPDPPRIRKVVPVPLDSRTDEDKAREDAEATKKKEQQQTEKVAAAKKEIFQKAGKRNRGAMQQLLATVAQQQADLMKKGEGKLPADINDIKNLPGIDEAVQDKTVAYIPQPAENVIVISDLPKGMASLRTEIEQAKFLEDMESDTPTKIVILADFMNRGTTDLKVVEAMLALKQRYPNNFFIAKSEDQTPASSAGKKYPERVFDQYYGDIIPVDEFQQMKDGLAEQIRNEPSLKTVVENKPAMEKEILDLIQKIATSVVQPDVYQGLYSKLTAGETTQNAKDALQDKMRRSIHAYITEHTSLFKQEQHVLTNLPETIIVGKGAGEVRVLSPRKP